MASEIKLPELGENLRDAEVVDVKVSVGDSVSVGQPLLEVEAEKSAIEVPSPQAGKVTKVNVEKGSRIAVGETICEIEEEKESAAERPAKKGPDGNGKHKEKSETPAKKEPSEKAARAPDRDAKRQEESDEGAGAEQTPEGDGKKKAAPAAPQRITTVSPPSEKHGLVPAGPATRHLARELGIDLQCVAGSGPRGRVTQEDVKAYVRQLSQGGVAADVSAPVLPDFERWGAIERRPVEPTRRRTAEHTGLAWRLIPHVTQHDQADITELEAFRKQQSGSGPKLTVTAFALKAAASALEQFPQFNSSLDSAAGQLVIKRYYHIGVAVDTERGLLVPVLRDVDKKGVRELAQELADVAERARQRKLSADDMRGGTFTITNLGGLGGTGFTPIVNYPEVAILGMSRAELKPVVRNGQIEPRLLLPLSLSYDHRVIDGADAARFTRRVAEMLEQPLLMLL